MAMKAYLEPLGELQEYREIRERLTKYFRKAGAAKDGGGKNAAAAKVSPTGLLSLTGCIEAQRAHMTYGLTYDVKTTVIVTENDLAARNFYEDYRFFEPDACLYPAKDLLFYQADVKGNLLERQRAAAFEALIHAEQNADTAQNADTGDSESPAEGRGRAVIILPAAALMDKITRRSVFKEKILTFTCGEEIDLTGTQKELAGIGYVWEAKVEAPGQFSARGDILDIWNVTAEMPVRIELFGDEIDSIRQFDAETQRSTETLESAEILPATDILPEPEGGSAAAVTGQSAAKTARAAASSEPATASFLDWFDPAETCFIYVEPSRIAAALEATEAEFTESIEGRIEQGSYDPATAPQIIEAAAVIARFHTSTGVALSSLDLPRQTYKPVETFGTTAQAVNAYNSSFEFLVRDLARYQKKGYRLILLSGSHTRAKRLADDLQTNDINAFYSENTDRELMPGEIMVQYGHLSRGFEYPLVKYALISETDIFGEKKKKKRRKATEYKGDRISSFSELKVGDYVVHENHGLGIYRGIEKVPVEGVLKDYIKLEYKGSNLYILATQLDMLQKYAGGSEDGRAPRLNKIGGSEWKNTKARVKKAVSGIARELVDLYAVRQAADGYRYQPDTPWQREFEELFPYEETDDQLAAIEATKRDMESRKIMDRLICGDVGYGKTEIALRAAFKAVQENKQVAILVPTTILAQQHYNTFTQRMKDFPVRVDLLSRFRTNAQQSKTITDLKTGMVDIVIGTHRLLSKDIAFKDLGLLVIDEEQRFGVTHKERIKEMRKNIDVLTLTATPIPRTLHMSLIGIRDMSVLEEPPQDRVPIQTYVMEYNAELVREAICRELNRHGQVYYVHNRVRDIAEVTRRISLMVPEANVAFADGQMDEKELENVMVDFINGDIDVLVTTTIIETGLDIPNVNTMIVQDADRMGLAQLYQLRGRIGRSNRTAYAFLMYRRDKMLKEVAEKRLSAIREFTELGSGIKIAMRDLEIRGAGNLLGAEQHGHMEAVGYDLYCKMLSDAVKKAKGEKEDVDYETVVDLMVDAFIPDKYIPDGYQKIDIYKRIALIADNADYEDMAEELTDRYGPLPRSVTNLLRIAEIKAYAHKASILEIKQTPREVKLSVLAEPSFDAGELPRLLKEWKGLYRFHNYAGDPCFIYRGERDEKTLLTNLRGFVGALAEL